MKKKYIVYSTLILALIAPAGILLFSKDALVFPHKPHIDGAVECVYCHKGIGESTDTTKGSEVPPKKICADCHADKNYSEMVSISYRQDYRMNHKSHLAKQGLVCKDCHEPLYKTDIVKHKDAVVKMEYCYQCHDNQTATRYCALCHTDGAKPDDHMKSWDKLHGKKAATDRQECQGCHTSKDSCLKCHRGDKSVKQYHNPNYELSHRYESRISLRHCRACHSERQCRDCHKARGVHYQDPAIRKRHPLGWANKASSNFHGKKARLNITVCTTCHTKNECNYCHFWFKRD